MRVAGLTGGIACGKSTVSSLLKDSGIPVIDCDELAHAVTRKGRWGWRRVVRAFGQGILLADGNIDRERLGDLVFNDPRLRRKLNSATHLPIALTIAWQLLKHWLRFRFVVVIDMPLLFESGSHKLTKPVVVVSCQSDIQVQRLVARDGCSQEAALAKISSQMPLHLKCDLADIVIENNGSVVDLQERVQPVIRRLTAGAALWGVLMSPASAAMLLYGALRILQH